MIVIVQDANILIDLERCDLLGVFLGLDEYEHHTTDFVLSELPPVISETLRCNQVEIRGFTPREVAELLIFKEQQPAGLSLADCSVFSMRCISERYFLRGTASCARVRKTPVFKCMAFSGCWIRSCQPAWLSVSPWLQLWRC